MNTKYIVISFYLQQIHIYQARALSSMLITLVITTTPEASVGRCLTRPTPRLVPRAPSITSDSRYVLLWHTAKTKVCVVCLRPNKVHVENLIAL